MTQEETLWQRFSPEEIDRHVQLLIVLRMIRRRRIWVRYTVERHTVWRGFHWRLPDSRDEIRPDWEYQVTKLGELALKLLNWLTVKGVL